MKWLALLLILNGQFASAQNLLMNGGFEDENICTEYDKNCAPEGWISSSFYNDYYFEDAKNAYEGSHFAGILTAAYKKRVAPVLRTRLLCGLRKGARYRIELAIRSLPQNMDSIGIYFSSDDVLLRRQGMKGSLPQLWIRDSVSDFLPRWQRISLTYTATGDEGYFAIGDFKKTDRRFYGTSDPGIDNYFMMDELKLTPEDPHEQLCSCADSIREEEYAFNPRHEMLSKWIYRQTKLGTPSQPLPRTVLQRVDTLVIPDVLFATGSFALTAGARSVLDSFRGQIASKAIDSLVVEGHTDSIGSPAANEKLSRARAESVGGYLQSPGNLPLILRGWGSQRPVDSNRTPAGRQRNRRVELYVYIREQD